jgi:hypothetical protein
VEEEKISSESGTSESGASEQDLDISQASFTIQIQVDEEV